VSSIGGCSRTPAGSASTTAGPPGAEGPEIVQILFTAIVGSLALGLALAFGLGGRNVAERLLEEAYQRGQEQRGQAREDLEVGKERARRDAQRARARVEGGGAAAEERRA
jgi:hypothetical protein